MGERAIGEYEGEGEKGGRERDCSVVVYVSLRSCVGRSAPSRHCCCCEKRQNKGLPTLWNPYTFAGSALLWSHPKGMLLKWAVFRSTAGINWAVTQSVTEAGRKLNSKVRHHPVLIFLVPFSWVYPSLFPESGHCWKVSIASLKVWRRHRCGLFVEGVAVDTDGREAALEPEARVNKPPAAESAATEHMGLNQAMQTWDPHHTFCEGYIQRKILNPICCTPRLSPISS